MMNQMIEKELLRSMRAAQKANRKGIARPPVISRKVEIYYLNQLLAIVDKLDKEGKEIIDIVLSSKSNTVFVGDTAVGDGFFGKIKTVFKTGIASKLLGKSKVVAEKVVRRQKRETDLELSKQLKMMTGAEAIKLIDSKNLDKVINDSIKENVALIKSIPVQYHEKVERLIRIKIEKGKSDSWLETQIARQTKVARNRARFIATDQIGKINGVVNKVRQTDLGIDKYIWRTVGDNRVRAHHVELNNTVRSWDNADGDSNDEIIHPGEEYGCRCSPQPYIDVSDGSIELAAIISVNNAKRASR